MKAINFAFYHLGQDIKLFRVYRGYSVEYFAEKIKCRPETVLKIERGELDFSSHLLFLILDTLKCDLHWKSEDCMPYLEASCDL